MSFAAHMGKKKRSSVEPAQDTAAATAAAASAAVIDARPQTSVGCSAFFCLACLYVASPREFTTREMIDGNNLRLMLSMLVICIAMHRARQASANEMLMLCLLIVLSFGLFMTHCSLNRLGFAKQLMPVGQS